MKVNFAGRARGWGQVRIFLSSSLFLLAGLLILFGVAGRATALPPSAQIQEIWEVLDKASGELASITESDYPEDQFSDDYSLGFWKLTVFTEIASYQERVRDIEGLRRTARRAEEVSKEFRNLYDGVWLAWIAKHQIQAGDQAGAVKTVGEGLMRARKHGIENFPDGFLEDIIEVQALVGEVELAIQTSQWVEEPTGKSLSLSRVALSYAQKNKESFGKVSRLFQEAIQESMKVPDIANRVRVLLTIAQQQNEAGMMGEARKTIALARATIGASVKEDKKTVGSLGNLALLQIKYSDPEEGKATFIETIRRAKALPKKADAAIVLQNLAWSQIVDGDKDGAQKTLEHARQMAEGIGDKDIRAKRLQIVGNYFGIAGEAVLAKQLLLEVFEYLLIRPTQESQSEDLFGVVYVLLSLPNLTEKENSRIQNVILDLVEENFKESRLLLQLVRAQVLAGEFTNARHTREAILNIEGQAEAAQTIGAAKVRLGNVEDSLRWVSSLDHPYSRTRGFLGVAGGLLEK